MLDSNISIKIVGIVAIGLTALVFLFIAIFGKHIGMPCPPQKATLQL